MAFESPQPAFVRLDVVGYSSHGPGQRSDGGNKAIEPRIRLLHLPIGQLLGIAELRYLFTELPYLRGVLRDLVVVFQLLIVKTAQRRPEILEAAKAAHCR